MVSGAVLAGISLCSNSAQLGNETQGIHVLGHGGQGHGGQERCDSCGKRGEIRLLSSKEGEQEDSRFLGLPRMHRYLRCCTSGEEAYFLNQPPTHPGYLLHSSLLQNCHGQIGNTQPAWLLTNKVQPQTGYLQGMLPNKDWHSGQNRVICRKTKDKTDTGILKLAGSKACMMLC